MIYWNVATNRECYLNLKLYIEYQMLRYVNFSHFYFMDRGSYERGNALANIITEMVAASAHQTAHR